MYQDGNETRNRYMVEKDTNMTLELVNSIVDTVVAIQQNVWALVIYGVVKGSQYWEIQLPDPELIILLVLYFSSDLYIVYSCNQAANQYC